MVFFNTEITQNDFIQFLKEMSENDPYSKDVRSFPALTPMHIGKILASSHFILRFINLEPNDIKISVTVDDVIAEEKTVSINVEVLILSVFLGTSLFR